MIKSWQASIFIIGESIISCWVISFRDITDIIKINYEVSEILEKNIFRKKKVSYKFLNNSNDKLAFDHYKILDYAIDRIRNKIQYTPIAVNLLPRLFTVKELQYVYAYLTYTSVVSETVSASNKLEGMTILATGTLQNFTRDGIKESVIANGGKYASGVNGKLSFMIVGAAAGSSKIDKANKLGIKMISEEEYLNLIK